MYIHLDNNKVTEIIPDFSDLFPNVPITERYAANFLQKCIHIEDNTEVKVGMDYDSTTGTFAFPKIGPTYSAPIDISEAKLQKISDSKIMLAEWLENNPMHYSDGKYYTVTEEKQSLLNSNLASYERANSAGIPYPLKWNARGEECITWEYEALVALSLSIAAYVAPKVSKQQALEIEINNCETTEDLEKIVISYN